jgi:LmbE family N-acetylglucosaminyl deacetylase
MRNTALCIVAHPDDETILCGGTLALLGARGVAVHVVCLTRGEGGEVGEPPLTDRAHLGQVREREMACAVGQLGALGLIFLGYEDPVVGPGGEVFAPAHDPAVLASQLAAHMHQTGAQVVITHGSDGEYGHPAHKAVHSATLAAAAALGPSAPLVYSFAANYPEHPYPRLANAGDPADLVVDVTPYLDQKTAAALCHATQNALFVRRRSEAAGRPLTVREVLLAEEAFHRHWPASPSAADPLRQWLGPASTRAAPPARDP